MASQCGIWYNWGELNSAVAAVLEAPRDLSHEEASPMTISDHTPMPTIEQEEWRPVVGYEGLYDVSSLGRVRRVGKHKGARVGRILACSGGTRGYRTVNLHGGEAVLTRRVHHLVAAAFIGPMPPGMEVNHKDTNRSNNHSDNLEYVTPKGNSEHMVAMGHSMRGERSPLAKLDEEKVRAIRALRQGGVLNRVIGEIFGVSESTVRDAVSGRGWGHVD